MLRSSTVGVGVVVVGVYHDEIWTDDRYGGDAVGEAGHTMTCLLDYFRKKSP